MTATPIDRPTLQSLRDKNPAWRLLASDNAPFTISFLHQAFIASNTRTAPQHELAARLEDHLREARDAGVNLPRSGEAYLDDWADNSSGWLRKFYPPNIDEPHFDLTPAAERAIQWISRQLEPRFVGTQSRLLTVFNLLTEMIEGSEADPDARLVELQKRRDQIDAELARLEEGHIDLMDSSALRERFHQMASTARELLSDFRELEQRFHHLDRDVRQKMAGWEGGRGELLDGVLGDRDAISSSDEGVSFRAFWDFLMSPDRLEELSSKLRRVFELAPIRELQPDGRLRRIHYDWLAGGELTQRTIAKLSSQLRQYLDDRAWVENRRIMTLIRGIEQQALLLRDAPPVGTVAEIDAHAPSFSLLFERPLFTPPFVAQLENQTLEAGDEDVPADELFNQVAIDRARLRSNIRQLLLGRDRVSLAEVVAAHPLEHGLAELVGYFSVASEEQIRSSIDEKSSQQISWHHTDGVSRSATIPLVVFER